MKKIFFSILFIQLLCISAKAQFFGNVVYNRKAVYAEIYGNSLGAALNYEYLYRDHGLKQGLRFGSGYFVDFLGKNSPTIISGNIEYIAFTGAREHHIEWGIGATYHYKYYKQTYQSVNYFILGSDTTRTYTDHIYKFQRTGPAILPRIGYRYESPDGGLVVRVGYTPVIYLLNKEKEFYDGTETTKTSIPFSTKFAWGGVSIGFSFY
ncbi:MAG: hypothetical protein Q8M29_01020 [Bacteroidota bacterium]|nr:hypothetical protein [Bacteroidota bacterium]